MILLYHNLMPPAAPPGYKLTSLSLPGDVFESHLAWLRRFFQIVPLEIYLAERGRRGANRLMAITLDDGLSETFETIFPVLQRFEAPVTIFATTSHLQGGGLIWGSYLNALCFEDGYPQIEAAGRVLRLDSPGERKLARSALQQLARESGDPVSFTAGIAEKYPLAPEIAKFYQGLSLEQLRRAGESGLVEIGGHTVSHPYLSECSTETQQEEIAENIGFLAAATGRPVRFFAYPSNDYCVETLEIVRGLGIEAAFATFPRQIGGDPRFEISRTGIYSPSIAKLLLKAFGFSNLLRRAGFPVG